MGSRNIDEKKTIGVSYIFTFFTEVQNITHTYTQYVNLLMEVKNKFDSIDSIPMENKDVIMQNVQLCRHYVLKSYIMYNALYNGLKVKDEELNKEIVAVYSEIKEQIILDMGKLETYVILLNKFVVNEVIQELLKNNEDLINDIFKDDAQ